MPAIEPDNYGLDPNQPGASALFPTFDPLYLTVVRITGTADWQLAVNFAHFDLKKVPGNPEPDPIAPDKLLLEVLNVITAGGPAQTFRSKRAELPRLYEWRGTAGKWDVDNFAGLGASCQTEMVFWLDIPSAKVDPAAALAFARSLIGGGAAEANDTYTCQLAGGFQGGPLIRVRNHFAELDAATGKYIDRKDPGVLRIYEMNIHFALPLGNPALGTVPFVIDPSSGNGGGAEP